MGDTCEEHRNWAAHLIQKRQPHYRRQHDNITMAAAGLWLCSAK